jgi:hypothetical protein
MHAVAYQHIEERQAVYESMLWGVTAVVAAFQIAGWWKCRPKASREM